MVEIGNARIKNKMGMEVLTFLKLIYTIEKCFSGFENFVYFVLKLS